MFFWLSRMYIHGAYYSNYQSWCKDPYIVRPSSHLVWSIVGQESLNGYTSSFCMTPSCESVYTGIEITSGLFQVWHSSDIYSLRELEGGCMMTLNQYNGFYRSINLLIKQSWSNIQKTYSELYTSPHDTRII